MIVIGQACVEHGFFYVTNHGVDRGLLQAVFAQSKGFFDLPMEEKMALLRSANHRGYTPPYAEKLDASSQFVGRGISALACLLILCTHGHLGIGILVSTPKYDRCCLAHDSCLKLLLEYLTDANS